MMPTNAAMKAAFFPCLVAALAACDAPSPNMRGALTREVTVGPSTFTVHRLGDRAEAVRTNFEMGRKARGIMARGYQAIELATGCQVVPGSFTGDPALMKARIACDDVS